MSANPEKVQELRESAETLAKQALETAELGVRLVRDQVESALAGRVSVPSDLSSTFQSTVFGAETKAKEIFTLATSFLNDLNDKWQPATHAPSEPAAAAAKPEKIDIDLE